MIDIDKERADFESARQRGVFKPAPDACPTWLATQLREEGWQARAATPQAPAKDTLLVTLNSALAAIEHLSQSNSSGRDVAARRMLVDVAPSAPTPAAAEGQEPAAPHILEALSYHANERDDLTLEEAVEAFRYGWKKVRGRSEREMLAQLIYLMASAPAEGCRPSSASSSGTG